LKINITINRNLSARSGEKMNNSITIPQDTKKIFKKLGTCSRTFCFLLDRAFGHSMESEEHAADPLVAGIMKRGHQCGMLWGCALAVGAESHRVYKDRGKAIAAAITGTQYVMKSFLKYKKSVNCREITGYDLSNKFDMIKFMAKVLILRDKTCYNFSEEWAPEAIQSAKEGLSSGLKNFSRKPVSCASEVVKKMGAGNQEIVMVAGLAGGMGLSGNGCGALGAATWLHFLRECRVNPDSKKIFSNQAVNDTIKGFLDATDSEMSCNKICGRNFNSIDEHSEFIKNGGCDKLINLLAGV
jgi:hypothetical protein